MSYIFQTFGLMPPLSAAENVGVPLRLRRTPVSEREERVDLLLDLVGLRGHVEQRPAELSGGQQQRVAIARALVGGRRLVLADEPTGALDSETGEEVLRILRRRCDEGVAGLLVTHEARHAAWADRVVFLRDGRVVDTTGDPGRVEDLLPGDAS